MATRKSAGTYVLGTGLSHDGSACLLKDGVLEVAIEKERITRVKHDGFNDDVAIRYCLDAAGIGFDDVDLVVQNANFSNLDRGDQFFQGERRAIPKDVRVETISHHLAHAYSVIGTSPHDDMAILIIDGCGSSFDDCIDLEGASLGAEPPSDEFAHLMFEKDSYYIYENGELRSVFKDFSPFGLFLKSYLMCPPTTKHSIGGLYSAVSQYVFQGMEDPGKLMGLAPYGKPGVYDHPAFDLQDGRVFVRYDWMSRFDRPRLEFEDLDTDFQYYADIAYWMQREIERALLYVVESRHDMVAHSNLGYAGGVALNAVANARILAESPFEDLYIQPAAADNGLALGCAYYGWLEVLGGERKHHSGSTYFGRDYGDSEIRRTLDAEEKVQFDWSVDYVERTAELLAQGKTVAWFDGRSEFGPRALGRRSILADPRRAEMVGHINRNIKRREDFRPFAPSVAVEDAGRFFDCDHASPYMILVAPTREEWRSRIPAVVHCDGSARLQTVSREMTPRYHDLLKAFERHSGIPILLNTSLNRRGMPIVETPQEALDFFLESELDALVINGFLATKRGSTTTEEIPADRTPDWRQKLDLIYGTEA
ncbi:MAG: transferase [Thermoanaerobaculia bacterium]|nr:transferase [Thermoanaerobaculia bacterium]